MSIDTAAIHAFEELHTAMKKKNIQVRYFLDTYQQISGIELLVVAQVIDYRFLYSVCHAIPAQADQDCDK